MIKGHQMQMEEMRENFRVKLSDTEKCPSKVRKTFMMDSDKHLQYITYVIIHWEFLQITIICRSL